MPKKSNAEFYEEQERELYGEAIRQTDQEIFDDALNRTPDDNDGDNDLEQMDDDDAPTGDEDDADPDEEGDEPAESEEGDGEGEEGEGDEPEPEPQDRHNVPPGRLREATAARRAAEAERDAALARNREIEVRLQNLERSGNRQQGQQQAPPQRPDMFSDPEGWEKTVRSEIENTITTRYVNASLSEAHEEHGEKFQQAFQALTSLDPRDPTNRATVEQIYNSPNPGRSVMRWHQRQQVLRDVGSDPQAYRNKVAQELMQDPEFRQQFLENMRGDAMNGNRGQPRTRVRLPASLNGASGGEGHRSRDPRSGRYTTTAADERDIADSVWDN